MTPLLTSGPYCMCTVPPDLVSLETIYATPPLPSFWALFSAVYGRQYITNISVYRDINSIAYFERSCNQYVDVF